MVFESAAESTRMGSAPDPPSVINSADSPGFRGDRSPSRREAISRSTPAFQRVNTSPVRKAPLIAEPGRYGPLGPEQNVGMKRFSARACSQYVVELECSNGMRRPAKFWAEPPHDAKSSFSALRSWAR